MNIALSLCRTESLLMPYSFEIFSSISAVPSKRWQRWVPADHVMYHPEYFLFLEENLQGRMAFRYVFIKQHQEYIGFAYFQLVKFRASQLNHYRADSLWTNQFKHLVFPLINVNLLVGANLLMTGEKGFFFPSFFSDEDIAQAYLCSVQHLLKTEKNADAFLMTDIFVKDKILQEKFSSAGFHTIYEEPDMAMKLKPEWITFSDYVSSLSSKYRVRAKKCLSISEPIVRREFSLEDLILWEDAMDTLYRNTISRSRFSLLQLQKGFFAGQKRIFADRYSVFGYFLNDKLIGFNSLYCYKNSAEVHYVGLDYSINKSHQLYLRMLLDMVQCGIERRFDLLHFGRTAPEIKSSVGAVPIEVSGLLRHKNPLWNRLIVKPFAADIKPKEFVYRNPFKEA
jgi:hypothetical protein